MKILWDENGRIIGIDWKEATSAISDDVSATLGFESDNCDRDFQAVVDRGAAVLEPPTDKAWGVRTAYFKGPGELKFEIEGPIAKL